MKTLRWLYTVLTDPEMAADVRGALTRRLIMSAVIAAAGCAHAPKNEPPAVAKSVSPEVPPERIETLSFGAGSPADEGRDDQACTPKRRHDRPLQP